MDMTTVLREVDSWPVEERIRLVQEVWDRLVDGGVEPALTDDQKGEIDRRLADLAANPDAVVTWEEIERHVRRAR